VKCAFGVAPRLTSLYYCLLFEHLFMDYLFTEYPVLDVDLHMISSGMKLTTITLQRQNTPTRQQLEMLRPISVEEIEDTQNKVNEHLLSTSGMNKEEIENASHKNKS
jgi:hypothetical protein